MEGAGAAPELGALGVVEAAAIGAVAHDVARVAVVRGAEHVAQLVGEGERERAAEDDGVAIGAVARREDVGTAEAAGGLAADAGGGAAGGGGGPGVVDGVDDEDVDAAGAEEALQAVAGAVVSECAVRLGER